MICLLVSEAAKKVGMSPQTLRLALQQGVFPFGVAIKTSSNRYTYKIFPMRLEQYLKGVNYEEKVNDIGGCDSHIGRLQ